MNNILITDYRGENVMVFTTVPLENIKKTLDKNGEDYSDIFYVEDDDLQYYLYEPLHLNGETEKKLIKSYSPFEDSPEYHESFA